jgi:hypothetical protein
MDTIGAVIFIVFIVCMGLFGLMKLVEEKFPFLKGEGQDSPGSQIICPHCGVRARVTTSMSRHKTGLSGGKVAGAVLTGGASMLATGLSRKEWKTDGNCGNCGSSWSF